MSSPAIHQTVDLVKDEQTKFMRLLQVRKAPTCPLIDVCAWLRGGAPSED